MHVMKSKWGFEIEGLNVDLENARTRVNTAIETADDPFIALFNSVYILRSARWDAAETYEQVAELANYELGVLRSCIGLFDGVDEIIIGTFFGFDDDDQIVHQSRQSSITVIARAPEAGRVSASQFSALYQTARRHPLGKALAELSAAPNWFEIYKSLEALENIYGGETDLIIRFQAEKQAIKAVKRTANAYYRHTLGKFKPPENPFKLDEAHQLLQKLITAAASDIDLGSSKAINPFGVQNHKYEDDVVIGLRRLTLG